jgi:endoribonuclease Dicer
LTDLRQTAVNNESFGRVAIHLKLHDHLWHNSKSLEWEIGSFVSWYTTNCTQDTPPDMLKQEGPKVLGDLFEALAGAVLIDTNFDIDRTWKLLYPLYGFSSG